MSRAVGFLCLLLVVAAMAAPVIQKEEHGATTGFAATGADKMSDMKKSHKVPHSSPERAVGGAAAAASGGVHAAVRIGMLAGNETSNETVAEDKTPAAAPAVETDNGGDVDGGDDDSDEDSKSGFWKKMIGGSSVIDDGEPHKPSPMPNIIWVLPIVGFCGVGIAITAYCLLGT